MAAPPGDVVAAAGGPPRRATGDGSAAAPLEFPAPLMRLGEGAALIRESVAAWIADRAMSKGAAIAFYTIFSLAPILLLVITIAGLAFGREAAEGAVMGELGGLIGEQSTAALQRMLASADDIGSGLFAGTVGVVLLLLAATAVLAELQDSLNLIWRAEPPPGSTVMTLLRARLISLSVIIAIGFLLLVSLVINAAVSGLGSYLDSLFPGLAVVTRAANLVVSFAVTVALFGIIFKVLPDARVAWSDVWIGAVATAVLFTAGKFMIGFYIGRSAFASSYGAAGAFVVVLVWVYYSAQILLLGAEFTRLFAERHGSRSGGAAAQPTASPQMQ